MRYASLALRTPSRLDLTSSRGISSFVNRSAMFVEAVFKSTFGFSYVFVCDSGYIVPCR